MTTSRPYLIRAIYEWLIDNQLTPHISINALHEGVEAPQQYVKDDTITLNISPTAVKDLKLNNHGIEFDARFSGIVHHIYCPVRSVLAIFSKENGRGMGFDEDGDDDAPPPQDNKPTNDTKVKKKIPPHLKIVK